MAVLLRVCSCGVGMVFRQGLKPEEEGRDEQIEKVLPRRAFAPLDPPGRLVDC